MTVLPASPDRIDLLVDLDGDHAAHAIRLCLNSSRLGKARFALLMGVSGSSLKRWLNLSKPIPAWAIRAAYFAAIASGVPVRFKKPGLGAVWQPK